jgi:hypothetical protein|tara:strand:+ start:244 stop:396 length:153 start_codon:yes stop_codon:yes gene_type:complete
MIDYILSHYKEDLMAMAFTYVAIGSIIAMFLPKNNFFSKIIKELKSLFKK